MTHDETATTGEPERPGKYLYNKYPHDTTATTATTTTGAVKFTCTHKRNTDDARSDPAPLHRLRTAAPLRVKHGRSVVVNTATTDEPMLLLPLIHVALSVRRLFKPNLATLDAG